MAEIVAAALTSHAPLVTGRPDVSKPEQRDRLYAGFGELHRRLASRNMQVAASRSGGETWLRTRKRTTPSCESAVLRVDAARPR